MKQNCDNSLRCSFCRKPQGKVGRLISTPSDYPRAYICDECVTVCTAIIEDDRPEIEQDKIEDDKPEIENDKPEPEPAGDGPTVTQEHPLLGYPLASSLMQAIETWLRDESVGADAALAFADVRRIATQMLSDSARR